MVDQLARLQTALTGRYTIERELGRGGMAIVYLAQDLKHRRSVAIKVLHPELAAAVGTDRFLREIEIAASLTHPHIVPLHDSGEADSFAYYVMPYVEGESLRERLTRETQLPLDEAVQIGREVADALHRADGAGDSGTETHRSGAEASHDTGNGAGRARPSDQEGARQEPRGPVCHGASACRSPRAWAHAGRGSGGRIAGGSGRADAATPLGAHGSCGGDRRRAGSRKLVGVQRVERPARWRRRANPG